MQLNRSVVVCVRTQTLRLTTAWLEISVVPIHNYSMYSIDKYKYVLTKCAIGEMDLFIWQVNM